MSEDKNELLAMTTEIVSAHLNNLNAPVENLSATIKEVYETLKNIDTAPAEVEKLTPAVPVKKSVYPDYIICLEDGKKLKMLKRHLMSAYGMTPEDYRARWNLPADYPMVAPAYAEKRSNLAREIGLGRKISGHEQEESPAPKRGRTKKTDAE